MFRGFLTVFIAAAAVTMTGRHGRLPEVWISEVVWSAAALALLAAMTRQFPAQNAVAVALGAGGVGWLMSRWTLPDRFPEFLSSVVWIVVAVGSRGSARWMLCIWHGRDGYGWAVMMLGTGLSLGLLAGGVFAGAAGKQWAIAGQWTATSVVIHLITTPWFIDKRPILCRPDGRPVVVMVLMMVWQWMLPRS